MPLHCALQCSGLPVSAPSSHVSPRSSTPLPHFDHPRQSLQRHSFWSTTRSPSQSSSPSILLSPQTTSPLQEKLHEPILPFMSPSSHVSPGSSVPLPQLVHRTEQWPGTPFRPPRDCAHSSHCSPCSTLKLPQ